MLRGILRTHGLDRCTDCLADQLLLSRGAIQATHEAEKEAANERLTEFPVKRARDAEFLLDAQYPGLISLPAKPNIPF